MSFESSAIFNLFVLPVAGLFVLNIYLVWLLVNKIFPVPETASWVQCTICSACMAVLSILTIVLALFTKGLALLFWFGAYRFLLEVIFDLTKPAARSIVVICGIVNVGALIGSLYLGAGGIERGYRNYGSEIETALQNNAPFELEIGVQGDFIVVRDPATGNDFSGSVIEAWEKGTEPENYARDVIAHIERANNPPPPATAARPPANTPAANTPAANTAAAEPSPATTDATKTEESDDPWGAGAEDPASAPPTEAPNRDLELAQADVFVKSAGDKWAKGDYEGALQLADKAYQFRLIHLGAEHPDTLAVLDMIRTARARLK